MFYINDTKIKKKKGKYIAAMVMTRLSTIILSSPRYKHPVQNDQDCVIMAETIFFLTTTRNKIK